MDQLENLKELRKVGHPFQAGFDLTEADGLLLVVSEHQQVLIYISAKCNITAKLIAESKKQMDCYSQLLKNIRVTLDAGDLSMTNQALLLKDLPNVQANLGARLTYRFQATCQALSALASQNTLIVGFIGRPNMLQDCKKYLKTCREARMEPMWPSGATFTIDPDFDLQQILFTR